MVKRLFRRHGNVSGRHIDFVMQLCDKLFPRRDVGVAVRSRLVLLHGLILLLLSVLAWHCLHLLLHRHRLELLRHLLLRWVGRDLVVRITSVLLELLLLVLVHGGRVEDSLI